MIFKISIDVIAFLLLFVYSLESPVIAISAYRGVSGILLVLVCFLYKRIDQSSVDVNSLQNVKETLCTEFGYIYLNSGIFGSLILSTYSVELALIWLFSSVQYSIVVMYSKRTLGLV